MKRLASSVKRAPRGASFSRFVFYPHLEVQLAQLLFVNERGGIHQQIQCALRFGESDYLADIVFVGEQHNQAIDAQRDTAMGRGAILERFQHVPELLFDLFLAQLHEREDFVLQLCHIDTQTPASDLMAITNEIVLPGTAMERISVKEIDVRLVPPRE